MVAIAAQAESWAENQRRYWGAYGVTLDDGVAPSPTPSKPLSLSEFDRLVREVVAKRAPKASVLTDGNQVRLDAWIRCGGLEEHFVTGVGSNIPAVKSEAERFTNNLIRRLGEREVGL